MMKRNFNGNYAITPKTNKLFSICTAALVLLFTSCTDERTDSITNDNDTNLQEKSKYSVKIPIAEVNASTSDRTNIASNVLDKDPDTRWSGEGNAVDLEIDLKSEAFVDYLKIAFYKGDTRRNSFEVFAKKEASSSWEKINFKISSGESQSFEDFDLKNTTTRYLKLRFNGNTTNKWNSVTELEVWGKPGEAIEDKDEEEESDNDENDDNEEGQDYEEGDVNSTLDPNKAPSDNFDLSKWKITLSSGKEVNVAALNNKFTKDNEFYTDPNDGGMVFKNYPATGGTTSSSTYSRVEFREMLRSFDEDITDSKGMNINNWVFGSSSSSSKSKAGGVDGTLTTTLKVNRVTTTADKDWQVGRIIIGQIHAEDDEPCRLYYHKRPDHNKGALYLAHEPSNGKPERFYNLIGEFIDESDISEGWKYDGADEPKNGIALNEKFSYKIEVIGNALEVAIYKNGKTIASKTIDMNNSGYEDAWVYFKAGVYSGNKTAQSSSDYEKVTFYSLSATHN